MRNGFKTYATYSLALVATLAVGCGKKDKKDEAPAKAAAPSAFVVDSSMDGSSVTVKYKSSDANAKYKCKLEAQGQTSDWSDCPADGMKLPVQPGQNYKFSVKAIAADGTEGEPTVWNFTASGSSSTNGPAAPAPLTTLILNKDEVGETYGQSNLTLEFGVDGGTAAASDVRFECKRENQTSYRNCPNRGSSYEFADMQDGYNYALSVRAVMPDGTMAKEDHVEFRVQMAGLTVGGQDKLQGQTTGQVPMTYPQGAQCALDGGQPVSCTPTYANINLDNTQITQGNHQMVVTVQGGGRQQIDFCARVCTGTGVRPAQPIIQDFQLGSFYTFHIPEGMHVVNYSTTKTTSDSVYWLRNTDDMLNNDLDVCLNDDLPFPVPGREFTMLSSPTPGAPTYKYCATTPRRDTYKNKTEGRRALNNLEVSTNVDLVVAANPQGLIRDERLSFNVFDTDTEFMINETTFMRLCRNRNGAIYQTPPIRVIPSDYWREPVRRQLVMCLADIVEFIQDPQTGAVIPVSARWWVGSFFIASDKVTIPDVMCFNNPDSCGTFWSDYLSLAHQNQCKDPSLVEATIMVRQDSRYGTTPRATISDYTDFSRIAQKFFADNFNEIVPVEN